MIHQLYNHQLAEYDAFKGVLIIHSLFQSKRGMILMLNNNFLLLQILLALEILSFNCISLIYCWNYNTKKEKDLLSVITKISKIVKANN